MSSLQHSLALASASSISSIVHAPGTTETIENTLSPSASARSSTSAPDSVDADANGGGGDSRFRRKPSLLAYDERAALLELEMRPTLAQCAPLPSTSSSHNFFLGGGGGCSSTGNGGGGLNVATFASDTLAGSWLSPNGGVGSTNAATCSKLAPFFLAFASAKMRYEIRAAIIFALLAFFY